MSARPAVSVVIPVWNGERFLTSAIASVRGQSHPVAQVVVVDDGSTDAGPALAREAAAAWAAVEVVTQPNAGPAAARNTGVARATGDLLTFLDADDEMLPGRVATQVAHLAAHPEHGMVMGHERIDVLPGVTRPDWMRTRVPGATEPYIMSMMLRRAAWERVGPFDPARRIAEDVDWLFRARTSGIGIGVIDDELIRRRIHGDNLTRDLTLDGVRSLLLDVTRARVRSRRPAGGGSSPEGPGAAPDR